MADVDMTHVRHPVLRPARMLPLAMPPALLAEQGIGRGVQVNTRCVLTRVGVQAVVHDNQGAFFLNDGDVLQFPP